MGDGRPAEPDADLVETAQIRVRQIGIPLPDVVDRLIHPMALVFLRGLQNTAAVDVAEELVPRPIQEFFVRQTILQTR